MSQLVRTVCCEFHSPTCEPPSELCCEHCTEAGHGILWWYDHSQPTHADGTPCVLTDPEQRGYARGFAQGIAFAKARCGCEACNRLQSPSAPWVLGQVPPRPERGYAIDPFPSVRGSLLDPDPQETP